MKTKNKRSYLKEKGITLIALVVTIVLLLILAGVSLNAIFNENGIIKRAQDAQNKMDQATQNDLDAINGLNEWIDGKTNGATGDVTYTYSVDNIPTVQDGIVIENGTDGNQFVWVPVGTIKNKDNTTSTITLGRYEFDSNTGVLTSTTPIQAASVKNCTNVVTTNEKYQELSMFREGNSATDSTAENEFYRKFSKTLYQ